jgi:DNA-binding LacI/PurR family transcriptional regulator
VSGDPSHTIDPSSASEERVMTRERRPTIIDVAREAGVSRSLVSLVLQNPGKVSPGRKQAVHDAMERLGYRPNAAARSLAQSRTDTIGVLISDLHNPFYTDVIDGIEEVTAALGYRALIASGGRDPQRERDAVNAFIELRAEGIIMITPRLANAEISDLAALIPTVIVGRPGSRPAGCSRVHTDDGIGIALALDHLVGLGHERIAHVSAGDNPGARAREAAYRESMTRLGLGERISVVKADPNQDGGYAGAHELLAGSPRPTAILASNDVAAIGVLGAVADAGLSCPGDVSVVGYDNTIFAELHSVRMTTINQPRRLMGETAANLLREQLLGRGTSAVALEPELVVRSTSGPPPA